MITLAEHNDRLVERQQIEPKTPGVACDKCGASMRYTGRMASARGAEVRCPACGYTGAMQIRNVRVVA